MAVKTGRLLALAAVLTFFGLPAEAAYIDVDLESVLEYEDGNESTLGDLASHHTTGLTDESPAAAMSDDLSATALLASVDFGPDAADPGAADTVLIVDVGTSIAHVYDPAVQDRVLDAFPANGTLAVVVGAAGMTARPAETRAAASPATASSANRDKPVRRYDTPPSLAASLGGTRR